jgi:FkbM family methyltransferase
MVLLRLLTSCTCVPDATVLDIGGWVGITGLYYSTYAPRVVAVEPDLIARSELVANVALNPFLEPRIRVYDK